MATKSTHTDSAEYKLWGDGVALPYVVFVLSGITYFSKDKKLQCCKENA